MKNVKKNSYLLRGVGRYEIVVGHTLNPSSKSGGALCYQTTKKWWGTCPQAPPMATLLRIDLPEYVGDLQQFLTHHQGVRNLA